MKVQHEVAPIAHFMKKFFIAAAHSGPDALALCRTAPVGGCRNGSGVGAEANQDCIATVPLAHELPNVQFTGFTHFGRTRIAKMGIVLPDHDSWLVIFAVGKLGEG